MWGLAMLGLAGLGALGAAYGIGAVHQYKPTWETGATYGLGAAAVIATLIGPWWIAFLAVGAFAGQVVPQLYVAGMKMLSDQKGAGTPKPASS